MNDKIFTMWDWVVFISSFLIFIFGIYGLIIIPIPFLGAIMFPIFLPVLYYKFKKLNNIRNLKYYKIIIYITIIIIISSLIWSSINNGISGESF